MPPDLTSRRQFIRQGLAGLAASGLLPGQRSLAVVTSERRSALTLDAAYRRLTFNPDAADAFTVVWMADIHYGIGKAADILPPLIAELIGMSPRPAFIGVIGDLILTASLSFGTVPDEKQRTKAIEEFRAFKPHHEELKKLAPVKLTLGNHDTYPGEDNLGLFRSVFGDEPVTHAVTEKGVTFAMLNGGSSGFLGAQQQQWYCDRVKAMHRPGGTLITAVHQPSVGSVVRERGITSAVRDGLADRRGDLWVVGGHEHRNGDTRFLLPHGEFLTQACITAGNPTVWGTDRPGFWVWCFAGGKLVGRIFRKLGDEAGFVLAPAEVRTAASSLPLPFEGREDVLWKVMVGEGDEPYRRTTKAAWCLNYWTYVKQLDYEFPLHVAQGHARRCVVAMAPIAQDKPMRLAVSANTRNWQDIAGAERNGSYTTFTIPQSCLDAGVLALSMADCAVSGFALTT